MYDYGEAGNLREYGMVSSLASSLSMSSLFSNLKSDQTSFAHPPSPAQPTTVQSNRAACAYSSLYWKPRLAGRPGRCPKSNPENQTNSL